MIGMEEANWLSYLVLLAWPLVAVAIFSSRPIAEATAWTVLGGLLFLPIQVAIKVTGVPALDKYAAASVAAFVGYFLFADNARTSPKLDLVTRFLLALYIFSPIATSVLNGDPLIVGVRILPSVDYYDGISAAVSQLILIAPFFLGLRLSARSSNVEAVFRVFVIGGVVYSFLMLFEIRFSPQLSRWIYGVSPSFDIEMRYGGFRPVVFMANGLMATMFLSTALIAAAALDRLRLKLGPVSGLATASYFGVVLLLAKSAASLGYGLVGGLVVRLTSPRFQLRLAAVLAILSIAYPIFRIASIAPTNQIVDVAEVIFNHDRAYSLKFRFDEEERLLAHAYQRPWFGWGRFGRNRVYDDNGKDISITDGQWILTLGQFGLFGFFSQFGLLIIPIVLAAYRASRSRNSRDAVLHSSLSIIVAVIVLDQLPNASITPWTWFLVGILSGTNNNVRRLQLNEVTKNRPIRIGFDSAVDGRARIPAESGDK